MLDADSGVKSMGRHPLKKNGRGDLGQSVPRELGQSVPKPSHRGRHASVDVLEELTRAILREVEQLKRLSPSSPDSESPISLKEEMQRYESELIVWALVRSRGGLTEAARLLGVKKTTLHSKILGHGLEGLISGRRERKTGKS